MQLLDSFMHGEHQCLVFELLGPNLYDVLRSSKMRGLSFKNIRKFSKQILTVSLRPASLTRFAPPSLTLVIFHSFRS